MKESVWTRPLLPDHKLEELDRKARRYNTVLVPAMLGGIGGVVLANDPRASVPGMALGAAAGYGYLRYKDNAGNLSREERADIARKLRRGSEKRGELEYTHGDILRGAQEKTAESKGALDPRAFKTKSERDMSAVRGVTNQLAMQTAYINSGRMGRFGVPGVAVGAAASRIVRREAERRGMGKAQARDAGDRAAVLVAHTAAHAMSHGEALGGEVAQRVRAYRSTLANAKLRRVR